MTPADDAPSQVVRTILVSDLVDSTRVTEKLGDLRASEAFARQDRVSRDLLRKHHGSEIDRSDGFLCLFDRPHDAVRYALEAQSEHAKIGAAYGVPFELRVGIHLGEVVLRRNPPEDVAAGAKPVQAEGIAVPIAARISALSGPRQTLLTKAAFDLARRAQTSDINATDQSIRWLAHGPYLLKGIEDPVEVHEVGVDGFAPLAPPADSAKARRAVRAGEEDTLGWRPAKGLEIPGRPNFTLIEKLGEGGFGEVWLASHGKTQAKQVFKFCFQVDRLRGLKREVALFRVLQSLLGGRTDIARVIDWQFEHPPFFLEAEYTEGGTLAEWIESSGGCDQIPLDTRIEIAAQIATAVGAAHSVGVLHKDLKPSNILITKSPTGAPMARLTDFGIGLLTDLTVLAKQGITDTGMTEDALGGNDSSRTGSRLYMAPELLEGRGASIQSDIYSLGVVMYQLFGGGFGRAIAAGWESRVPDPLLREDIAACVAGNPDARLRSADELATRLRTRAKRRTARLGRRAAAATAVLAMVLFVATAFLAVALRREERLRLEAVAAKEAESGARKAEALARSQAEDLTYFMLFDVFRRLKEIGRLDLMEQVAQRSAAYLDATSSDDQTSGALMRRAMAYDNIGEAQIMKGNTDAALANYRSSLATREKLLARYPGDPQVLRDVGVSWNEIGRALDRQGDMAGAAEAFAQDVAFSRRVFNDSPADNANVLSLAQALNTHGDALRKLSRLDEALKQYREAFSLGELLAAKAPADPRLRSLRSISALKLGAIADLRGDYPQAAEMYTKALGFAKESLDATPDSTRLIQSVLAAHYQLASVLLKQGDTAASIGHSNEAIAQAEKLHAIEPRNAQYRARIATTLSLRGRAHRAAGDLESSASDLARAVEINLELAGLEGADTLSRVVAAVSQRELAKTELERGNKERAEPLLSEAIETLRAACGKSESLDFVEELAHALLVAGRKDEAKPLVDMLRGTEGRGPAFLEAVKQAGL